MPANVPRPYLGLAARLSQIWLNRWTLLLSVIFVHLLLTTTLIKKDLQSAQTEALAACLALEQTGSAFASLPHFMALGMNTMTQKGIEASVSALATTTTLMLTGVEELLLYFINSYKNTYLCLFTFAVHGSLSAVIGAAEDTVNFLNSTLATVETNILADAAAAQTAIVAEVEKIVGGIGDIFGDNITIPQIQLPAVSQLSNITIPDTVDKTLTTLNNSLPTFEQVKNATDTAISFPFEQLKSTIRSTFDNFTFNSSLLPVPAKETLQFCSNNTQLTDFFQELLDSVQHILIILAVVILLAALLAMIPHGVLEWWSWRKTHQHAKLVEDAMRSPEKPDYLEIVQILAFPLSYRISTAVTSRFATPKSKALVRWFIAYITHTPALLVLAVSIAAFVSCLFQIILLNEVRKAAPVLAADISDLESLISAKIQNASVFWINGTNAQISSTENDINNNLLGWARDSTQSLNNTLNTFVDTTITTINTVFGDTPLAQPILDVLNCVLLMKIQGIQDGLTFVNENAKVQFPRLDNSTFSAFASDVSTQTPSEDGSSSLLGILNSLVQKWNDAIRLQAVFAGILLAVYGLIVLFAISRVIYAVRRSEKGRGEGGGLEGLKAQGIVWVHSRLRSHQANPFEDPILEKPGPTPSTRWKQ